MTEKKVVWILGAGFSKSLGGPLLGELLSQGKWLELRERYPDLESLWASPEAESVYALYAYGTRFREGWFKDRQRAASGGIDFWRDAEHFLDYLDTAQASPMVAKSLAQLAKDTAAIGGSPDWAQLSHAARRLLAAECSAFLKENSPELERWDPYVNWMKRLTNADTVVTFNYDLVVETVAEHVRSLCVLVSEANEENRKVGQLHDAKYDNVPVLVKLHGSVDWEWMEDQKFPYRRSGDPEYALKSEFGTKLSICTPGSLKKTMTTGELAPLWRYAKEKIREADTIVFLGYRFPPSDAEARRQLTSAIADNKSTREHELTLHTVLGNDASGAHATRRLCALLEYAGKKSGRWEAERPYGTLARYRIVPNELFVEDFLSVAL